jgi:hypothetical protein
MSPKFYKLCFSYLSFPVCIYFCVSPPAQRFGDIPCATHQGMDTVCRGLGSSQIRSRDCCITARRATIESPLHLDVQHFIWLIRGRTASTSLYCNVVLSELKSLKEICTVGHSHDSHKAKFTCLSYRLNIIKNERHCLPSFMV